MYLTDIDSKLVPMPEISGDDPFRLVVEDQGSAGYGEPLRLMLHRRPVENGRPVLLLHGASAGSDTFLTPRPGTSCCPNLVDYLVQKGFEPWLLDWRSSKYVAERMQEAGGRADGARFNFDAAATEDVKAALDEIFKVHKNLEHIDAVGFCMGGGILAQALLQDLPGVSDRLSHVVLMSLGLFYNMNLYGRLKAEARLLERVVSDDPERHFLDPRVSPETRALVNDWPEPVERLYELWRRPYDDARIDDAGVLDGDRYVLEMFNRISFMFGEPYLEANLVPEIHDTTWTLQIEDSRSGQLPVGALVQVAGAEEEEIEGRLAYPLSADGRMVVSRCRGEFRAGQALLADSQPVGQVAATPVPNPPLLPGLFGAMPVHLHIHGAENLRAGQATRFSRDPVAPVPHINGGGTDLYAGFNRLERITLIGGALNRLWHRDSIDRMAAWLRRNRSPGGPRVDKRIVPGFGHQDLLWGRNAEEKVFPHIKAGLGPVDNKAGSSSVTVGSASRGARCVARINAGPPAVAEGGDGPAEFSKQHPLELVLFVSH